ncbi:hypothetical protein [Evansella clarkii]|uniref:hypothetical protein n=1 Tax=Evansella clarkii TaxID=79879 RepID=UPI0009979C8C|nr:hypothetical protein [Evansella clarkii]
MKKILIFTIFALTLTFLFVGQVSADSEGVSNNLDSEIVISDSENVPSDQCGQRVWLSVHAGSNTAPHSYQEVHSCGALYRGYLSLNTSTSRYEGYVYRSPSPFPRPN